jgi:NAD-dependent SIR2 family protein deacetylase
MQQGLLQRVYTQNIDGLEKIAGLPDDILVQVHGNLMETVCCYCHEQWPLTVLTDNVFDISHYLITPSYSSLLPPSSLSVYFEHQ